MGVWMAVAARGRGKGLAENLTQYQFPDRRLDGWLVGLGLVG